MKGFKSTSANPYTYTQSGVWKKGQYTFQAIVLSDSGYAFAFQRADTTWQTVDLSWQVKAGSYSKIQWTFTLEVDAIAFRLIANTVTGETIVVQPMLEKGTNGSTPIAHEEDLRGMDGDNHEFIFTRNDTGIAPPTPLSTQENDYIPIDDSVEPPVIWTDNPQGVTKELPFEFVSMREKKNGVWLDFSPPSLWAKYGEDGLSVNLLVEGHYNSHWEGSTKVTEIIGGVDVGGNKVVKVSAIFRKGEENIAATEAQSRGFQWYVNGVHLTAFDNQPFITLDETYGDGFADYVVLSYLVNSIREEERSEIINISEGMDGIGEEFIFKANNSDTTPPVLPQTTDEGYQDDDYHGDWSDDPVAPTELNQFVWVSKRKKIGGIWEAFGTPSIWTKWVTDGEPGAGIESVTDYYATSTSGTTAPSTGWQTTMPSKPANHYLWNYEVITYTDGRTPTQTQKRVIQGKDARSIYDIKNAYAYSSSDTVPPISGWQWSLSALGTKPAGYFLWVREDIAYTDNPSNYFSTIGYVVRDGADGEPGDDGEPAKSIHLNPSTKAIYITEGNTPVPASVTVTGTAVNTTIQYWYYSADGAASFTSTPPTGVTRSGSQVTINSAAATFKTLSIKARNSIDDVEDVVTITRGGGAPYVDETTNTWWAWNEELGVYTDTGYSPVGSDGAIPYPAGYYDNTKWYRREAEYAPYVQYGGTLYLLIKDTPNAGIPTTNTEYWKAFNNWQAVFVDSLVAAFAKIGGAVFTGDTSNVSSAVKSRMISQTGVDETTNYQNYTGDSGTWQPKIMLDFLTGKAKFEDVKVAGRIISPYATSLITDVNNWIDVSTYSNFYVPTLPGGSGSGWYYTTLPSGSEYSGITLNFVWRPIGTGYAWRIRAASGMIHTPSGDKSYVELTSDTYRIVQLVGFWNTGTSRLEWILTDNRKWGNDKEDRVLAGEVFLAGYVNSTGAVLSTSSKFGFTFSSSKVSTGQYSVTVNKYPYNPLSSSNYTQIITPYNPVYNTFSGLKTVNNSSFGVYTNSDNAPIDSAFKFILIANEDLDLRNQTYL